MHLRQFEKIPRVAFLFFFIICLPALTADKIGDASGKLSKSRSMQISKSALKPYVTANVIRHMAMKDPLGTMRKWMEPTVFSRWEKLTKPMFSNSRSIELSDFFAYALIFIGLQTDLEAYSAFYNVWLDTIMLLKIDPAASPHYITDFAFLPGSVFRNDIIAKNDELPDLMRLEKEKPYVIKLANTIAATKRVFRQSFTKENHAYPNFQKMKDLTNGSMLNVIRDFNSFRLIVFAKFASDETLRKLVTNLFDVLFKENAEKRGKTEVDDEVAKNPLFKEFMAFPRNQRAAFKICNIVSGPDSALFCLTRYDHPDSIVLALVTLDPARLIFFASLTIFQGECK